MAEREEYTPREQLEALRRSTAQLAPRSTIALRRRRGRRSFGDVATGWSHEPVPRLHRSLLVDAVVTR